MHKPKAKHADGVLTAKREEQLALARRRCIRSDLAGSIERALCMGEYDDACNVVTLTDRNYVESLVTDITRKLREA